MIPWFVYESIIFVRTTYGYNCMKAEKYSGRRVVRVVVTENEIMKTISTMLNCL